MLHDVNMLIDGDVDHIDAEGEDLSDPDITLKAFRGYAKSKLGDIKGAITDYSSAIKNCDTQGVIGDYSIAIQDCKYSFCEPMRCEGMEEMLIERAQLYFQLGMTKEACFDMKVLAAYDENNQQPKVQKLQERCNTSEGQTKVTESQ